MLHLTSIFIFIFQPVQQFNHEIKDLGLNFTAELNTVDFSKHVMLLMNSDLKYNTRYVRSYAMQ